MASLDPAAFWQITPREVMVILDGADARARAALQTAQQLSYCGAVLTMIGTHNPKKFPKFEQAFAGPGARTKAQGPDEIYALMAGWADAAKTTEPMQTREMN